MAFLGIDIGSTSSCAVVLNEREEIVASASVPTGARNARAIASVTHAVLVYAGLQEEAIRSVVSTGYGRENVPSRHACRTEISCHARGILKVLPDVDLLVDIGGQDSKAISIHPSGRVLDFAMNDKCAAGTGRFLESMARVLETDLPTYSELDIDAKGSCQISSMCTVFAESEVVSMVAQGVPVREIAAGINRAIASRTVALSKRIRSDLANCRIAMSGGVARNAGVVRALGQLAETRIYVPQSPEMIGALGAALFARDRVA